MMININNYEIYFLDYLEGNLNPEQITELYSFLAMHPDKKEELESVELFSLTTEEQIFNDKSILKKSLNDIPEINEQNFEEFCIAKLEGDLSISKLNEYQEYLKSHPEKQALENLYKHAFLEADEKIKYPYKSKLKKFDAKGFYRKIIVYSSSVAAAALVLFGLSRIFITNDVPTSDPQITSSQQKLTPQENNNPEASRESNTLNVVENGIAQTVKINQPEEKTHATFAGNIQSPDENELLRENIDIEKLASITPNFEKPVWNYNINTGVHTRVSKKPRSNRNEYMTIPAFALSKINQKVKVIPTDSLIEKTLPELAETGIQKIYALLEDEISIEKKTTDDGKTQSFSLNTRYFSFYTTKTRN